MDAAMVCSGVCFASSYFCNQPGGQIGASLAQQTVSQPFHATGTVQEHFKPENADDAGVLRVACAATPGCVI